jgi:hypothetical protein
VGPKCGFLGDHMTWSSLHSLQLVCALQIHSIRYHKLKWSSRVTVANSWYSMMGFLQR